MVRLVFRPYTQIRRSICTSESLRTSTRVSSGFILFKHSSPSFGSHSMRSTSALPQAVKTGLCCPQSPRQPRSHIKTLRNLYFHYAFEFRTQWLAHTVYSLVRVSRRVGKMSTFDTATGTVYKATTKAIHMRKSHAIYARNDFNNFSARWPVP